MLVKKKRYMVLFINVNGRNCFFVFVDIDKKKIFLIIDIEIEKICV